MTPAFRALWTSSTAANLADGLFKLALPLYVAGFSDSPAQVAGAVTALTTPWLLLSLPVGRWVDLADRRRLMLLANLLRVAVLALLAALHLAGWMPLAALYALAFLLGSAEVVADTAAGALLPMVVEREHLEAANARVVGAHTVGNEFVGPALGGLLFAVGMLAPVGASGGLYLLSAGALLFIKGPFRAMARAGGRVASRRGAELLEGLSFLMRHRLLSALTALVTVMGLCWSAWLTLMPLYAVTPGPLGLSPERYGLMLTAMGVGGVLGTLIAVPMQRRWGTRRVIGADILGTVVLLAVPTLWPDPWLIAAAAVVGGAGGTMWGIVVGSLRQRIVPEDLMGRVGAALRLFAYGAYPVGAMAAGLLAEAFGIRAVFGLGALASLALLLPFWCLVTKEALAEAEA